MNAPRILIGGTGSGCGKTTVTLAVLRALQRRGVDLRAFKCGPDYIDPMFHTAVLGLPSRNLDLFLSDEPSCRAALARCIPEEGCGVIEGVMGYYDGVSGTTEQASACHLARATGTPSVLVIRPAGQSLSLAALARGFFDFAPNTLAGVILNGVRPGMYPFYRNILERAGFRVFGYLPPVPEAEIGDRHLGLITAAEIEDLQRRLDLLADAAEDALDLDGLLALARTAPALEPPVPVAAEPVPVHIAIARDRAFCFYYEDNLDILRALGAELVEFSPVSDAALPADIDGLYLGGGYPELYAAQLTANESMRRAVGEAVAAGLPTVAECGGFLYLHRALTTDASTFPMVGALPVTAHMTNRLQNFGYVTLTAARDSMLCPAGGTMRAHEFHYLASDDAGDGFTAVKPNGKQWPCAFVSDTLYAGYPHLHWGADASAARRFVQACARKRRTK